MSNARSVPVLMYHHVTPTDGMINVSPQNFESQLQWFSKHGYQTITCARLAEHLQGKPAPAKSVLITFDDGYLDNYVYAYPLLKKYGFNAAIFLVTSWVGDGPIRNHAGKGPLPDTPDHAACSKFVQQGHYDSVALRWSEVEQMQADGVFEFHSHTHTHTRWDKSDQAHKNEHMLRELAMSREKLIDRLGSVSEHFCWPQGYFDSEYQYLAYQAGFRYLYTTHAFGRNLPGSDPGHIYRFAVRNTSGTSVGRRTIVAAHPLLAPAFNRFKLWKRTRRQQ